MASKLIFIRWIRTGSQPNKKIMYSIELWIIFYEFQNHENNTRFGCPGPSTPQYYVQLVLLDKGRAIEGLVVCNHWDLEL